MSAPLLASVLLHLISSSVPDGTSPNTLSFLPFFLSLGIVHAPPKKADRDGPPPLEQTGPFDTVYYWKQLDFAFPSEYDRRRALDTGDYVQKNNLPLGLEVYRDRVFVTMPKWKPGVPATLAVLPRTPKEASPKLVPYPNWDYHATGEREGWWGASPDFRRTRWRLSQASTHGGGERGTRSIWKWTKGLSPKWSRVHPSPLHHTLFEVAFKHQMLSDVMRRKSINLLQASDTTATDISKNYDRTLSRYSN